MIAIGDIHGCLDSFRQLVTGTLRLEKTDRLVLLGDYIDRGPDSKGVIDFIMQLVSDKYEITALMGNHEDMMLNASKSPLDNYSWMINGGYETLKNFGSDSAKNIDRVYIDFIASLPKYIAIGDFIFVHGGFNDEAEDPFSDEYSMLWERRFEYKSPVFKGKIVVHGHRPHPLTELTEQLEHHPEVINIDTGCVYGRERGLGDLTAIDLYSMKLYSVRND